LVSLLLMADILTGCNNKSAPSSSPP